MANNSYAVGPTIIEDGVNTTVNGQGTVADPYSIDAASGGGAVSSVNGQTGAVVLNTGNVAESGNLYFTAARTIATAITGFVSGAGVVAATDSILQAINKIVGNIALKQNKVTVVAFPSSRSLTADDDGKVFDMTNPSLTATVPAGLPADFACSFQLNSLLSITASGTTLNGAGGTITRSVVDNGAMISIVAKSTTNAYTVTGF